MREVQFVTPLHVSSQRNYLTRMNADKPHCMRVAKQWGADYWDGKRCFGYGGMKYDKRWKPIAEAMGKHYGLKEESKILDIGCGKGFLLTEFEANRFGLDISKYACKNTKNNYNEMYEGNCTSLMWKDSFFNFTYSINVFHNLNYRDLKQAIREMVRVTKPDGNSYICVESYRNEEELTNLQAWQLTCLSYYNPADWKQILTDNGYNKDVEFIYFE